MYTNEVRVGLNETNRAENAANIAYDSANDIKAQGSW